VFHSVAIAKQFMDRAKIPRLLLNRNVLPSHGSARSVCWTCRERPLAARRMSTGATASQRDVTAAGNFILWIHVPHHGRYRIRLRSLRLHTDGDQFWVPGQFLRLAICSLPENVLALS